MESFAALAREIGVLTGTACADAPERTVAGGSINTCYYWPSGLAPMFVKVGPGASHTAFMAEVDGLRALHAVTTARFGWWRDNTIGRTPQANAWNADWTEFFRECRLRPQLALGERQGFPRGLSERGARLLEALPALLEGHQPRASLLHGDLWGGNWLAAATGEPVLFDPAVYYGDRETDLAMTHLFGGFGAGFYHAYESAAPLPAGAALRTELYNLYHVLNHANLFGGGYAAQARATIDRLLSEVGA